MKDKLFDYYIFMDYSESLVGYIIINKKNIKELLSKTSKLKHYNRVKNKSPYLLSIKRIIDKQKIMSLLEKSGIKELRQNIEICSEIFDFCKKNRECKIFISVDDRQYRGFMRLANTLDGNRFKIIKEGKLKKDSMEHRLNLIIDNLLNLKRTR